MELRHNLGNRFWHKLDRLPETEGDLKHLVKLFPQAVVTRKSNDKAILLSEAKLKNLHWYK